MRWAVNSRLSLNAGGTWQSTKYTPLRPATISVNPTFFGLTDNYYGGRIQTTLTNDPAYAERSGYPDMVLNLNGTFFFTKDLALNLSTSYQEEVASGRIKDITLPSAVLVGASLAYDTPAVRFQAHGEQSHRRGVLHAELTGRPGRGHRDSGARAQLPDDSFTFKF